MTTVGRLLRQDGTTVGRLLGDCYDKMERFSLKGDNCWETAMTRLRGLV